MVLGALVMLVVLVLLVMGCWGVWMGATLFSPSEVNIKNTL